MSEETKPAAPQTDPNQPPPDAETEDEGLDPRVLIVVGVIVLIIVFFYWRKASPSQEAADAKTAGGSDQAAGQQQPMTFRDLVLMRRSLTSQSLFRDGDRYLILASLPTPLQPAQDGKQVMAVPGSFFDITKRAEGIQVLEFVRRVLGPQLDQPAFSNTVPPLGYSEHSPKPVFKKSGDATQNEVSPDEAVFAFGAGGAAKAYPLRFLRFYDIINDECGGVPVVAVYNGVGGATSVFSRALATDGGDAVLHFGSSGLLLRSANVMYDDASRSLWSGVSGQGVAGARTGAVLAPIPSVVTRLSVWLKTHPETLVMTGVEPSTNIEYGHDYATGLPEYHNSSAVIYPLDGLPQTPQIHPKTVVFGVMGPNGSAKAYAAEDVASKGRIEDTLGGAKVTIVYDTEGICARAEGPDGKPLPCVMAYWMSWAGAFPKTGYAGPAPQPPAAQGAADAPASPAAPAAPVAPAEPDASPAAKP